MKKKKNFDEKKSRSGALPSDAVRRLNRSILILSIAIIVLAVGTIMSFLLYHRHMNSILATADSSTSFRRHFSYVGDSTSSFQNAVYDAA